MKLKPTLGTSCSMMMARHSRIAYTIRLRLLLALLTLPAVVQAQDYTYTTNDGTITITGYVGGDDAVTIPSTINGLPVTRIGNYAFQYNTNLTSVTIPNSVTSIGDDTCGENLCLGTFSGCTSLTNVTIGNSVTNMGRWAFSDCTSLTSVTIGNSVTSIEYGTFYGCTSLASVTIPDSVTSIEGLHLFYGFGAFSGCTSVTSVTLGNSVTSIEYGTFYGCTSLASVTIPNSVTSIGSQAFSGCTSLTAVYFKGNAPSIDFGPSVFERADNATVYYLPGTTGWGATFGGRPTAQWLPEARTSRTNQFGFNIRWASDKVVVVEASQDLSNPVWTPVSTNTLTGGSSYFTDSQWTNHPTRFYRLRSP